MASIDSHSLPSASEFHRLSRKHSLVPVYRTVTADLETPVSAFLRIAAEELTLLLTGLDLAVIPVGVADDFAIRKNESLVGGVEG